MEYLGRAKGVWDDALHRVREFSGRQQAIRPRDSDEGGLYRARRRFRARFDFQWQSFGVHFGFVCGANPAAFLRAIADAFARKLVGKNKKIDDALLKSFSRADRKIRKGQKGYDIGLTPECRDWYPEFVNECKRKGVSPAPTEYAAKRRLKILGRHSEKKKKPLRAV